MYTQSDHESTVICEASETLCNTNQCILKHLPLKKRFCSRKQVTYSVVSKSGDGHASKFRDYQILPNFEVHRYQVNKSTVFTRSHSFKSLDTCDDAATELNSIIVSNQCHKLTTIHHTSDHIASIQVDRGPQVNDYQPLTSTSYSTQSSSESQSKSSASNSDQFYETCSTCHKIFYTENSFKIHLRRHLNKESGKYKCKVCGQTFSQRSGQVSHSRVHTREKPYLCDMCPKRFADFSTYTKHKRVHTGEKPYSCPCCHSSFSQSGNLHRHVRVVHKVQSTSSRN